jgi:glucokinase
LKKFLFFDCLIQISKAIIFSYTQDSGMIGLSIGYSEIRGVNLNDNLEVENFQEVIIDNRESVISQTINLINQLKQKYGDFQKIGIAVSGVVDKSKKKILFSKQRPEYSSTDFAEEIRKSCGVESILENDANAGAWAEYCLGAGKGSQSIFYVYLSKGVGGAFISEGKIWYGKEGFAGELGQILVNTEENLRLEDVASWDGIVNRIKNRIHQDQTSSLARISEELITINDVIREANNKDGFTEMMLERTGTFLGIAVATIINLLNVEKVIIGGEIMQAPTHILKGIRESAEKFSFQPSFQSTLIIPGSFVTEAPAIGAALIAKGL